MSQMRAFCNPTSFLMNHQLIAIAAFRHDLRLTDFLVRRLTLRAWRAVARPSRRLRLLLARAWLGSHVSEAHLAHDPGERSDPSS